MPFDADELALLEAIHADPRNDAPRLAYADWLENDGELARAMLIRIQCERQSLVARRSCWNRDWYIPPTDEDTRLIRRILKTHGNRWFWPMLRSRLHRLYKWERGMPVAVWSLSSQDFHDEADEVIARVPPHHELEIDLDIDTFRPERINFAHPVFARASALTISYYNPSRREESAPKFKTLHAILLVNHPRMGFYHTVTLPAEDCETLARIKERHGEWPGYRANPY